MVGMLTAFINAPLEKQVLTIIFSLVVLAIIVVTVLF